MIKQNCLITLACSSTVEEGDRFFLPHGISDQQNLSPPSLCTHESFLTTWRQGTITSL